MNNTLFTLEPVYKSVPPFVFAIPNLFSANSTLPISSTNSALPISKSEYWTSLALKVAFFNFILLSAPDREIRYPTFVASSIDIFSKYTSAFAAFFTI